MTSKLKVAKLNERCITHFVPKIHEWCVSLMVQRCNIKWVVYPVHWSCTRRW